MGYPRFGMRLGNRQLTDYAQYLVARSSLVAFRRFPRRVAMALSMTLAECYRLIDRRYQEIARTNLQIAFPEFDTKRRDQIIAAGFRNLARLIVEVSRLPYLDDRNIHRYVRYDDSVGLENFLTASEKGRGVLFLTGHFSSWELLPYAHALYGFPLSFVVRPLDNPYVEGLLDELRCGCHNQTIPKNKSTRAVLHVLSRGGCVGILIDQNVMLNEGIFVPFFGKLACTTTGLARLALKTGAAVIPTKIRWDRREGLHRMMFWPEVALMRSGDKDQDIVTNTAEFNRILEDLIRLEPEAWLWGHRRWLSRPPEDPDPPYKGL